MRCCGPSCNATLLVLSLAELGSPPSEESSIGLAVLLHHLAEARVGVPQEGSRRRTLAILTRRQFTEGRQERRHARSERDRERERRRERERAGRKRERGRESERARERESKRARERDRKKHERSGGGPSNQNGWSAMRNQNNSSTASYISKLQGLKGSSRRTDLLTELCADLTLTRQRGVALVGTCKPLLWLPPNIYKGGGGGGGTSKLHPKHVNILLLGPPQTGGSFLGLSFACLEGISQNGGPPYAPSIL